MSRGERHFAAGHTLEFETVGPAQPVAVIGNAARESPVLIGDSRGTARVDIDGTVYDLIWRSVSPTPLIDDWQIEPAIPYLVSRTFLPRSNVLATRFDTDEGSVRLLDALIPPHASDNGALELVRTVEGLTGNVPLNASLRPHAGPAFVRRGAHGLWSASGRRAIVVQEHGLLESEAGFISGSFRIAAHEHHTFSLTAGNDAPLRLPPPEGAHVRLERTVIWWDTWLRDLRLSGPYAPLAERALLTLGLLLDEHGGVLTSDYRGWGVHLDSVATTLRALEAVGATPAMQRMGAWLLRALRRSVPPVPTWSTTGRPGRQQEPSLAHTGDLIDGVHQAVQVGLPLSRNDVKLLLDATERVQREWRFPEVTPTSAFPAGRISTHARVRYWLALDRMVKLHEQRRLVAPVERISAERAALRAEIEIRGYSERATGFTAWYGDTLTSPELLLPALWGYEAPTQLHMKETLRSVVARGFVHGATDMPEEVQDSLVRDPIDDAPTIPLRWTLLTAWCEASNGNHAAARARLAAVASLASDVGVVPDVIERQSGLAVGEGMDPRTQALLILTALRYADPVPAEEAALTNPRVRRASAPDPTEVRAPQRVPTQDDAAARSDTEPRADAEQFTGPLPELPQPEPQPASGTDTLNPAVLERAATAYATKAAASEPDTSADTPADASATDAPDAPNATLHADPVPVRLIDDTLLGDGDYDDAFSNESPGERNRRRRRGALKRRSIGLHRFTSRASRADHVHGDADDTDDAGDA